MRSVFDWPALHGAAAAFVLQAILFSATCIVLLLAFILLRRLYRQRHFAKLNARILYYRQHWGEVLNGGISAESWRLRPLDCEIVESILLGELDAADAAKAAQLVAFLRATGLLDQRVLESDKLGGWRRRDALLSLGRMRAPEVIPPLARALDAPSAETRLAAARGLGRTGLPEAAQPLLERIVQGMPAIAPSAVQDALLRSCRINPSILLRYIPMAPDAVRPLLVRVLGELVSPDLADALVFLANDNLAEVRASAARSLGLAGSLVAMNALAKLVEDPEWFVRLRAVAALGEMRDPRAIPILIAALCDENRSVRLRTAEVLSRFDDRSAEILNSVVATGDEYALQAFVSQLERMGAMSKVIDSLLDPRQKAKSQAMLLRLLQSGAHRMLLDALAHHAQPRVRAAVARIVAGSGDTRLLPQLQELLNSTDSARQRKVVEYARSGLKQEVRGKKPVKVPV